MKKSRYGLVILLTLHCLNAFPQEKFGQFITSDRVLEFQSYPDESDNIAVAYVTSTPTTPRTYKTHFISFSPSGQAKVTLPFNMRLYGCGYTDSTFVFFMRTKEDETRRSAKVDILEVDKKLPKIKGNKRIEFKEEELLCSFADQGRFYLVTLMQKPGLFRIREFTGAKDPRTLSFPITNELYKKLSDRDRLYQFIHNRFELQVGDVYSRDKMFFWSNKLYLVEGYLKEPKKSNSHLGLRLLEFPLHGDSGEFSQRDIKVAFTGQLGCFPLNDRLFLFECRRERFSLSVASLSTLEIEKTLTQENEGGSLLMGKYYNTEKFDFWKGESLSLDLLLRKDPETMEKRLRKFDEGDPFVYARAAGDNIVLYLGEYHFPTSIYTEQQTVPSTTIKTPYGNFTTKAMTTTDVRTKVAAWPVFSYVVSAMNVDLTVSPGLVQDAHSIEQVGVFAGLDENQRLTKKYEIGSAASATYLIGYSNREDFFTIWKWKRE